MCSKPLVSVVIPFLNAERFILEAIESVFKQTYRNWELLVVDDGSTDESTAIALCYAKQHPEQVRYLEHEAHQNRGASASRNLGSSLAKGEYVAFLDADDVWLPHKLERQVAILESQPETAMVYGPGLWWYSWTESPEDGEQDHIQDLGIELNTLITPPDLVTLFLRNEDVTPSSLAILVRRKVLESIGGSEDTCRSIYDDQILLAKLSLGAPVYVADECWYWYRKHPNQRVFVTHQTGQYQMVRLAFLKWLQHYLSIQGVKHTGLWVTLQSQLAVCYLDGGDFKMAARFLNKAFQHGPLAASDSTSLCEGITRCSLASEDKMPLEFARDFLEPVVTTTQARHLRRQVLSHINAALAFLHYQAGESHHVWRHALGAVIRNPTYLRNRGLMRIGLQGFGSDLINWIRS